MIEILQTDKFFYDSPLTGENNCVCSRCGNKIPKHELCIRAWPTNPEDLGYDASAAGGTEFRYCEECATGKRDKSESFRTTRI